MLWELIRSAPRTMRNSRSNSGTSSGSMKMQKRPDPPLLDRIFLSGDASRCVSDGLVTVPLARLRDETCLSRSADWFAGRSVIVATGGQLTAALALIELDGVA